ncbi:MAG TPA: hypothetical protein ENG83_12035 [Nitrospirae bacterium]|nr:glycosyl hydrolases family 43 [bacterium BMS3Abin06]HDH12904.1 hypothetical protein [Nitrospirota bacterium]HDZ01684.1 hypothetical protein [Nitrospirota bacterium]
MKLEEILNGKWKTLEEPVLLPSLEDNWENFASMSPEVFSNKEYNFPSALKFGMFYIGVSLKGANWGIGYAESDNLINWKKHEGNPLILPHDKEFNCQLDAPSLLMGDDGKYHLICEEKKIPNNFQTKLRNSLNPNFKTLLRRLRNLMHLNNPTVVNHAMGRYFVQFTSADPFSWDIASKRIIFRHDSGGTFDSKGILSPQIYQFKNQYYLFYGGTDGHKAFTGLATADSIDGVWRKVLPDPILSPGEKGDWDEMHALITNIIKTTDAYCAFYEGEDCHKKYRIGIAYSYDLEKWTKWEGNPIIDVGEAGSFNELMVCGPRAFFDGEQLNLFFNTHDKNMSGCCGLAVFHGDN